MNDAYLLPDEKALIAQALAALDASAGVRGELLDSRGHKTDSAVRLHFNGHTLRYECEVKRKVDRNSLLLAMMNQPGRPENALLISSPISQEMSSRCRELGLQFVDTAGNAFLNDGKGIYIYITGRRRSDESQTANDNTTITPAALRMMFAFLADPSLLNAAYRDISAQVKISTGAIGKVLEMLEARRLVGTTAHGKRLIRSPELFLNEWASNYVSRLRPKLKKWRFGVDDLDKFLARWSPEFRISALGGEAGAALETRHLRPEEATIYLDTHAPNALNDLVKEYRLRADPHGQIEVVEMFWNSDCFCEWFPAVPPHLVYADLLATHDNRNIAAGKLIASKVIQHVHDKSR